MGSGLTRDVRKGILYIKKKKRGTNRMPPVYFISVTKSMQEATHKTPKIGISIQGRDFSSRGSTKWNSETYSALQKFSYCASSNWRPQKFMGPTKFHSFSSSCQICPSEKVWAWRHMRALHFEKLILNRFLISFIVLYLNRDLIWTVWIYLIRPDLASIDPLTFQYQRWIVFHMHLETLLHLSWCSG